MNLKKLALVASMALAVGCASHPKPVAVNNPPPPPVVTAAPAPVAPPAAPAEPETPKEFKVTVNGASLTLETASWDKNVEQDDVVIVSNDEAEVRLMFAGTALKNPAAFDKTITTMVTKSGGKVLSSKAVKLGDVSATFHDTVNGRKVHIFVWTAAKDGNGWLIQCGSPSNPEAKDVCTAVANTLAIE